MKNLIFFLLLATSAGAQTETGLTIPPTPGFRLYICFDGVRWSQEWHDAQVCLHYFLSADGFEHVSVHRGDMSPTDFLKLEESISDSLMWVNGVTTANDVPDSFEPIFRCRDRYQGCWEECNPGLVMNRIADYFQPARLKDPRPLYPPVNKH